MSENVASDVPLATLDELDIRLHALSGERLGKQLADVRVRVQTTELSGQ